jgi:putative molybdopterin biosynthesis protein
MKKHPAEKAILSRRLNSSLKYREFVRTRLGMVHGKMVAVPLNRGAGVVSSFVKADGIIDVPQDLEGYEAGEEVKVRLLRDLEEIKNLLVITGSHDPLIDEAADLMKQVYKDSGVASSHVGSMGGIMALKRNEAHLGGIHLLDEKTNQYNISYVKKYFPDGGVVLIEVVKRIQGLIVTINNPFHIHSIKDVKEQKLSYVNRQKGSGTRILFDYLLKQQGISPNEIDGYDREEFTHTNVAAIIAANSADAGMGIYSAAKLYGLDFIPVCEEEYDLLIREETLELPSFKRFLEVIKSNEFRKRLDRMGGYTLSNPGNIITL